MSDETVERGHKVNGHRPKGLLPLAFAAALSSSPALGDNLAFDVDKVLSGVIRLHAEIPADAYTAPFLGTEREGNGIVIDGDGLILTIGYLVMEAMAVSVEAADGRMVPAQVVAYDYDTGFGLVRAQQPLGVEPLRIGDSGEVKISDPVLVAGHGGRTQTIGAFVVSKREFAGYWEYLLDEAIFTSPVHPNWGGTALIGQDGRLLGVGSLYVEDSRPAPDALAGNMFVPIDLLKPILGDLLTDGRGPSPPRPWLGMFTSEVDGRVEIVGVAENGPAARHGLQAGDVIVKIGKDVVTTMPDLFRKMWAQGNAGAVVPMTILRGSVAMEIPVTSEDRNNRLKLKPTY